MTGNYNVDNLASIYTAIQQYDPYGDNSFLIALALSVLFTLSIAYFGIDANSKEIESLFPTPQSHSNIPRNSMPPPLDLIKTLVIWGCLYVICFVASTTFTSLFVMNWSKNELVDRTFINSKLDLFIRIFLVQVFAICQCMGAVYFCVLLSFYWTPERLDPPPKILCAFNNRETNAKIVFLLVIFGNFIMLIGTFHHTFLWDPYEGNRTRNPCLSASYENITLIKSCGMCHGYSAYLFYHPTK